MIRGRDLEKKSQSIFQPLGLGSNLYFSEMCSRKRWQYDDEEREIQILIQKNPIRCNSVSKFIIPYLYEAQHVSGDTPPIIRSLKLH